MIRRLPIVVLALSVASSAAAGFGAQGGEFLSLIYGARGLGMGEAYTGVAEGVESVFWNPAGLGDLPWKEVRTSYGQMFEGMKYAMLAYGVPAARDYNVAFSVGHFTTGDIPKTRSSNRGLFLGNDGSFEGVGQIAAITIGYTRWDHFTLGGSGKFVRESVDALSDSAMTFDGGILLDTPMGVRLGASYLNVGGNIGYIQEQAKLPATLKFGLGLMFFKSRNLILAIDHSQPRDGASFVSYGAEYKLATGQKGTAMAVRGGFRPDSGGRAGEANGWTMGMGLGLGRMTVDYAFVPYGELGDTHRLSLSMRFKAERKWSNDREAWWLWGSDFEE